MWWSEATDYGVKQSKYAMDVAAQFAASCREHNIRICYYFDAADGWDYEHGANSSAVLAKQRVFLQELLTNDTYGPIHRFWLDDYASGWSVLRCLRCLGVMPAVSASHRSVLSQVAEHNSTDQVPLADNADGSRRRRVARGALRGDRAGARGTRSLATPRMPTLALFCCTSRCQ